MTDTAAAQAALTEERALYATGEASAADVAAAEAAVRRTTTPNALDLCNACDIEDAHVGCTAGYCSDCCPAH